MKVKPNNERGKKMETRVETSLEATLRRIEMPSKMENGKSPVFTKYSPSIDAVCKKRKEEHSCNKVFRVSTVSY